MKKSQPIVMTKAGITFLVSSMILLSSCAQMKRTTPMATKSNYIVLEGSKPLPDTCSNGLFAVQVVKNYVTSDGSVKIMGKGFKTPKESPLKNITAWQVLGIDRMTNNKGLEGVSLEDLGGAVTVHFGTNPITNVQNQTMNREAVRQQISAVTLGNTNSEITIQMLKGPSGKPIYSTSGATVQNSSDTAAIRVFFDTNDSEIKSVSINAGKAGVYVAAVPEDIGEAAFSGKIGDKFTVTIDPTQTAPTNAISYLHVELSPQKSNPEWQAVFWQVETAGQQSIIFPTTGRNLQGKNAAIPEEANAALVASRGYIATINGVCTHIASTTVRPVSLSK